MGDAGHAASQDWRARSRRSSAQAAVSSSADSSGSACVPPTKGRLKRASWQLTTSRGLRASSSNAAGVNRPVRARSATRRWSGGSGVLTDVCLSVLLPQTFAVGGALRGRCSDTLDVRAGARVNLEVVALIDKARHLDHRPGLKGRRLRDVSSRVATDGHIGCGDFKHNEDRQVN